MGKWTRRGFIAAGLLTGGVLAVGVGIREGHRAPKLAGMMTDPGETLVNVWVKLSADNTVTAIVPHSEMGQGVFTSMAQMLAEEMDADWENVTFEQAPAHEAYANYPLGREFMMGGAKVPGFIQDSLNGGFLRIVQSMSLQITGGSTSVRFTGQGGMRVAGAAARAMLLKAASKVWDVPVKALRAEKSYIIHDESGRKAPFAEFAEEASTYAPPTQPKLKSVDEYTLMGTSAQRFDIPEKVDGRAIFAIDVDLPNMRYAAVMGPPVLGASVISVDAGHAQKMQGVEKIINEGDFIAVIASGYWHAEQALRMMDVVWTKTGKEGLDQPAIYDQFRADMSRAVVEGKEKTLIKHGDARGAQANAVTQFEADYAVPYLAHAAMEPLNAVAHVQAERVDIWIGHQNPLGVRDGIADELGYKASDVTVHNCLLGGGFGRKAMSDYALMAVRLAKHSDGPVKMIWSREQDMQQDFYRPATTARVIAGLDAAGKLQSWDYQFVHKHDPEEASHIPYAVPHQLIHHADSVNPIRFGPWRSVDHTQHGFFVECAIDELAHLAGQDPLAYRLALLSDKPRYLAVLNKVAELANWSTPRPSGRGLGVAITDSFGTIVAQIVEVDVSGDVPRVMDVWAVADAGFVVNPDGFSAQIEGGIIYGLSAALYGDITVEQGAVVQSNFHDYPVVRMDDAPNIHVAVINSGAQLGGGGEPGTPAIAPAVANAVFAATGQRIRHLPVASAFKGRGADPSSAA